MRFTKWIFRIVIVSAALLLLSLLLLTLTEYKPAEKEVLLEGSRAEALPLDTLQLLTWNIGYAGLDSTMDFFYDGGERTRQSREQTQENLSAINAFLHNAGEQYDIILLQEVDTNSKRSYKVDELSSLAASLPRQLAFFALNYKVPFVPKPFTDPMGKVEAGIATFTRFVPSEVLRHSYPCSEGWPMRLFTLKRCFMSLRYPLTNGKQLVVVNTHNSAYDDGNQRQMEMQYLKEFALSEEKQGNHVVVGGDWNQNPPGYTTLQSGTKYFTPITIDSTLMPNGWQWLHDSRVLSNRYLNTAYIVGQTQTTLLDFFLCSPNIRCIKV